MAPTKLRLWRVTIKPNMSGFEIRYVTTKSDNLVMLAREIENLICIMQDDFTNTLEFHSVERMGFIGE